MSLVLDVQSAAAFSDPLVLPTPAEPPRRPPLPIIAALVPAAVAAVLWLVTGSALTLLFAALGPLIALASLADGARAARRARRSARDIAAAGAARISAEVDRRHAEECAAAWLLTPDAARLLQRPTDIWRPARARGEALVIGAGEGASAVRIVGGGDETSVETLRRRATALPGAPILLTAVTGIGVVGPRALAMAVARSLCVQLCLVHSAERLSVVSATAAERWAREMPQWRSGGPLRLALVTTGDPMPDDADIVIAVLPPDAPIPRQCAAVLTLSGADTACLEYGAVRRDVSIDAISCAQAGAVAAELRSRVESQGAAVPGTISLAAVLAQAPDSEVADGLAVPIGRDPDGLTMVDLVGDGPHAIVAGVTGSGKSELLITWVAAMCATRTPAEVSFLLADFKGGTAFDSLAALPHVTGVLTDLDGAGAWRAISSLRAELRRREAALAEVGARDIGDPRVRLARLVIVVDEFAAMLAEHPELHSTFTDVAARGRALGMHLVLGTQRVSGVVRDALLANCPLRVSLRVTDVADSRAVIGTDAAARLSGDPTSRGMAMIRRAGDDAPHATRIALTAPADLAKIQDRTPRSPAPHRPWIPALPATLTLDQIVMPEAAAAGAVILGLADEPDRQRQPAVLLTPGRDRGLTVVGGAHSGKSAVIALIAAQGDPRDVVRIAASAEAAWDAVADLVEHPRRRALILIDDVDAIAALFPTEYAAVFLARLERLVRTAGAREMTIVLTAQRLTSTIARVADLLPLRAILPVSSRMEFVTAGGDPARYEGGRNPGRALMGTRCVQFALAPGVAALVADTPAEPPSWEPTGELSLVVTRGAHRAATGLAQEFPSCRVILLDDLAGASVLDEPVAAGRQVLVGDPDAWQRQWALLTRLRSQHEIIVDASCAGEFRALTGNRDLPPFLEPGRRRAWRVAPSGRVERVVLRGVGDG